MKLAYLAACGAAACLSASASFGAEPATSPPSGASSTPPQQTPPAAPAASAPPVAAPCCHVTAGSVVNIQLLTEVSTKTVHPGDHFAIKLSAALVVDGQVVIPAGVEGEGEVVDAARPGMAGKPAKLVLAARFLDLNGRRVALRAFKLSSAGKDNSTSADVLSFTPYVGILALAVTGGDVVYPAGVGADAKIAQDIDLPSRGAAGLPPAASTAPALSPASPPAPTPVAGATPQPPSQTGTKP